MSIVRFFLKISNYPYIHFKKNLVHGLIIFFMEIGLFLYAENVSVYGMAKLYIFGMEV